MISISWYNILMVFFFIRSFCLLATSSSNSLNFHARFFFCRFSYYLSILRLLLPVRTCHIILQFRSHFFLILRNLISGLLASATLQWICEHITWIYIGARFSWPRFHFIGEIVYFFLFYFRFHIFIFIFHRYWFKAEIIYTH